MKPPRRGISMIELLVVLAIAGVLLAIVGVQIRPAGAATSQAAQVLVSAVNQARFEAIRTNRVAGLEVVAGAGGNAGIIRVCRNLDESVALSCATGEYIREIDLSSSDLARALISVPNPPASTIFFDRRGVVRSLAGTPITITDRSGGNSRVVTIFATGYAEVQ